MCINSTYLVISRPSLPYSFCSGILSPSLMRFAPFTKIHSGRWTCDIFPSSNDAPDVSLGPLFSTPAKPSFAERPASVPLHRLKPPLLPRSPVGSAERMVSLEPFSTSVLAPLFNRDGLSGWNRSCHPPPRSGPVGCSLCLPLFSTTHCVCVQILSQAVLVTGLSTVFWDSFAICLSVSANCQKSMLMGGDSRSNCCMNLDSGPAQW